MGKVRVAIIGARGVGKYHARWWTLEGAEVAAIAGTSEASLAEAAADLKERIGFTGCTYTDVGHMLDAERPDIVDVCSPYERHAEHARAALEAGCHVLCEKPFVLDRSDPGAAMREAGKLIALARGRGVRLGVCTQYAMAARSFTRLIEKSGLWPITYFKAQLQAPAKGRAPDAMRTWFDLGPHVLSVFLAMFDGAEIEWDTVAAHFEGHGARVVFSASTRGGGAMECDLVTRNATEPPLHVRYFQFNDYPINVTEGKSSEGDYRAAIETRDGVHDEDDFMRVLIREFLQGKTISTEAALKNLELMTRIAEAGRAVLNEQTRRRPVE